MLHILKIKRIEIQLSDEALILCPVKAKPVFNVKEAVPGA